MICPGPVSCASAESLCSSPLAGWLVSARGELPVWLRNVEAGTAIEAALFRCHVVARRLRCSFAGLPPKRVRR